MCQVPQIPHGDYGHRQGGLTGINLNGNAMELWALSLHFCSKLIHDLTIMRDDFVDNPTLHKEESKARMLSDSSDRQKLGKAITMY